MSAGKMDIRLEVDEAARVIEGLPLLVAVTLWWLRPTRGVRGIDHG